MSMRNQTLNQPLPYPADRVYQALLDVLAEAKMTIHFQDAQQRRVFAGTGWSLFSWGENITVEVSAIDEQHTQVSVESKPKMSINFTAAPRHKKNIERILNGLHGKLGQPPAE